MNKWDEWIRSIAAERMNVLEMHMLDNPEQYAQFCEASRELDETQLAAKTDPDRAAAILEDAWIKYTGALGIELYLAGARDGGRIYHALTTGELPMIQVQEE